MRIGRALAGVFLVVAGAAAAQAPVLGSPASEGGSAEGAAPLGLEVSLSERTLYVRRGDEVVESYPVAVGKDEHPTPTGDFTIGRVIWNPRWVPPKVPWARGKTAKEPGDPDNPMGRVKMFFREPDYYIHGTIAPETLGEAASHGCIRMANEDILELARVVMENGGEPRDESWFQRVRNFFRRSHEVRLSDPVPVSIRS